MRDEIKVDKLKANPLQFFRMEAIKRTYGVIEQLYNDTQLPVPIDKVMAILDCNWGYHEAKVSEYLKSLTNSGRIIWNKDTNCVYPNKSSE